MTTREEIVFTPLNNFRDLGGMEVEGGLIRHGALWRSDDPSTSPADEIEALVGRGLTDVVDLRGDVEYGLTERGYLADHPVAHVRLPFGTDPAQHQALAQEIGSGEPGFERRIGHFYARVVADDAATIVRVVGAVAEAKGAALVHCTAGKDRTGMAIAGVLSVLGAPDEAIADDYALTEAAMDRIEERIAFVVRALSGDAAPPPPKERGERSEFMTARPLTMLSMLAALRREYGGYTEMLRGAGLSSRVEHRIRERMVVPGLPG
jgi:protein-tyrosine phosphatase